jgi:hypothetical protein
VLPAGAFALTLDEIRSYPKKQLPMWHQYRVELCPHLPGLVAGHDDHGKPLEFPAFFRTS